MANIIDYIKENGDSSFKEKYINELDKIILTRFSYLPFKEIVLDKKENIEKISNKMKNLDLEKFLWKDDKELILELGKSKRFKKLKVTDYEEIVDLKAEKQFSAITIWLPRMVKFISYRGTDASLVGWKEDFNMCFMQDIPSQIEGTKYLNKIGKKYFGKLILGGHSKGGNIAVYSAVFCKERIKRKILEIINADGPGFDKSVITLENYKKMLERTNTYIPQSSIIGRLLEHEEKYEIIYSTQKGLMQHDIYSWQIEGNKLKRIESLTNDSQFLNKVVKNWLQTASQKQKENFVNVIYDVLVATEAKDISDLGVDTFKKIKKAIKSYRNIDKEERKEIEEMIKLFFESTIKGIKENTNDIEKAN